MSAMQQAMLMAAASDPVIIGQAFDPARTASGITLSLSNKRATANGTLGNSSTFTTGAQSAGKYLFGFRIVFLNGLAGRSNFTGFGNTSCVSTSIVGVTADGFCLAGPGGGGAESGFFTNNSFVLGPSAAYNYAVTNDVMWALDIDNGKAFCGIGNGSTITWLNSGNPATGTGAIFTGIPAGSYSPGCCPGNTSSGNVVDLLTSTADIPYASIAGFQKGF